MRLRGYLRARRRAVQRLGAATAGLVTALAVMPAVTGILPGTTTAQARADESTISQDNLRDGWDPNEPNMSPAAVKSFVKLFATKVTGQVWAQPLVVGDTVIVATEKDHVYGLNAVTGAIEWNTTLGKPYVITTCNDLAPDVGITAAPVLDPGTGNVYVMAQVLSSKGTPLYKLFGLSPATGTVVFTRGIGGSAVNASGISFSPKNQMARPGLLVLDGSVFAAFGSHCDHKPYVGFVARIDLSTKALTLWSDETGVATNQAGIWMSGSGVMSDGPGRIFVTSGNGISPSGTSLGGHYAESVMRLSDASGGLSIQDFFSPSNATQLDAGDTDWGSGGPVGLPLGTATYPDVLAQIGKDGRVFLLNRDNLGRRHSSNSAALSVTSAFHGLWGHPAIFAGSPTLTSSTTDDYLYFIGKGDHLRALRFGDNSSDKPTLTAAASSALTFGYSSGSPAVTSNGSDISSAVVWAVYSSGSTGGSGMLTAYAAAPSGGALTLLNSWKLATTVSKFTNVATSNGEVFLGTRSGASSSDGTVYGFGPAGGAAPLAATQANFGQTPVSSATTRNVSVTAKSGVTVTGVTASTGATSDTTGAAQFTVDQGKVTVTRSGSSTATPVSFPVTLRKGDKLTAPVTFSPASPGGTNGTLSFTTTSFLFPGMDVSLTGDGTTPGLYSSPGSLHFALVNDVGMPVSDVPVGISVPLEADITNGSTQPQTISSITLPAGPYKVSGLPPVGTVLRPGQSIVVQVTFAPASPGSFPDSLSVSAGGTTATVSLAGAGLPPDGLFTASPTTVNFGSVPVGKKVTAVVDLTNTGNEPATVSSGTSLHAPFANPIDVTPQLVINAGYDVQIPVSFTPSKPGSFSSSYTLTWTDVTGSHTVTVNISGTGT